MLEIIPLLKRKAYSTLYSCKRFHCLRTCVSLGRPAVAGCWGHFLRVLLLQCRAQQLRVCRPTAACVSALKCI